MERVSSFPSSSRSRRDARSAAMSNRQYTRGEYAEAMESLEIPDELRKEDEDEDAASSSSSSMPRFVISREDDLMDDLDDEVAMEVDPPPRALVSAQMEFLIASAGLGERASEFSDAADAIGNCSVRAWRVNEADLKLHPAEISEIGSTVRSQRGCFVVLDARGDEADVYHWTSRLAPKSAIAIAAFKSVELTKLCRDEFGGTVRSCQREVEGEESEQFAAILDSRPASEEDESHSQRYSSSGTSQREEEMMQRKTTFPRRLFCVVVGHHKRKFVMRGARLVDVDPRVKTMALSAARDVYILDTGGEQLYVWYGALSKIATRAVGLEAALVLRRERVEVLGRCDPIVTVEQGCEPEEFWWVDVENARVSRREDDGDESPDRRIMSSFSRSKETRTLLENEETYDFDILSQNRRQLSTSMGCASVWQRLDFDVDDLADKTCDVILNALRDELLEDALLECAGLTFPSFSDASFIIDRSRGAPIIPVDNESKWWWKNPPASNKTTKKTPLVVDAPKTKGVGNGVMVKHTNGSVSPRMQMLALTFEKVCTAIVASAGSVSETKDVPVVPRRFRSHYANYRQRETISIAKWRDREPSLVLVAWHRGELLFVEIPDLKLAKKNGPTLRSSSTAVLDAGGAIYVWRGKSSGGACRDAARIYASEIVARRPSWCRIYELFEGSEPLPFRSNFVDWTDAEVTRTRMLADNTFSRDYALRRTSSTVSSPRLSKRIVGGAPMAWSEVLAATADANKAGAPESASYVDATRRRKPEQDESVVVARATDRLLARQRDVFGAVASMLRQSWSSSIAGATPFDAKKTHFQRSKSSSAASLLSSRGRTRRRRREYLCGDAGEDEEGDDDDDPLERRSRERRVGNSFMPEDDSGEHHVVAWSVEGSKLVRLEDELVGNFSSRKSYAILYGATVETVAAHDFRCNECNRDDADSLSSSSSSESTIDDIEENFVQTPHGSAADIRHLRNNLRPTRTRTDARFVLIFWEGENAPREDRSRWLLELRPWLLDDWAQELAVGTQTEHLRVRQRREPRVFLQIALRAMGGYAVHVADRPQTTHLFHVRGDSFASAVEVAPHAGSLCSADVFIATHLRIAETNPRNEGADDRPGDSTTATATVEVRNEATCSDEEDDGAGDSGGLNTWEEWTVWVWVGSGSNARARRLTATLVCKVMEFFGIDGTETKVRVLDECGDDGSDRRRSFWSALGGTRPYADHPLLRVPPGQRSSVARAPLFFVVSEKGPTSPGGSSKRRSSSLYTSSPPGSYTDLRSLEKDPGQQLTSCAPEIIVEAVLHTTVEQHSLLDDTRAIVVDAHFSVLVWLGKNARRRDAALAKRVAFAYAAATRSPPCRVRVILQGFECPHFKCLFHGWDSLGTAITKRYLGRGSDGYLNRSFVDPRHAYVARRNSSLRNLRDNVPSEKRPERPSIISSPSGWRKRGNSVVQNLILAPLLGALSTPSVNSRDDAASNHVADAEIQLGRVVDSPNIGEMDSDDDDILESSEDILYRANKDIAAANGSTMDIKAVAGDAIIQGAEDEREATRHRRNSCSF